MSPIWGQICSQDLSVGIALWTQLYLSGFLHIGGEDCNRKVWDGPFGINLFFFTVLLSITFFFRPSTSKCTDMGTCSKGHVPIDHWLKFALKTEREIQVYTFNGLHFLTLQLNFSLCVIFCDEIMVVGVERSIKVSDLSTCWLWPRY